MVKTYKIIDIYHTGHHGPKGARKVGQKYDYRRNKVYKIDTELQNPFWGGLLFKACETQYNIYTTEFIKEYDDNGYHYIETLNSLYELEEMTDEKLSELRSSLEHQ